MFVALLELLERGIRLCFRENVDTPVFNTGTHNVWPAVWSDLTTRIIVNKLAVESNNSMHSYNTSRINRLFDVTKEYYFSRKKKKKNYVHVYVYTRENVAVVKPFAAKRNVLFLINGQCLDPALDSLMLCVHKTFPVFTFFCFVFFAKTWTHTDRLIISRYGRLVMVDFTNSGSS